MKLIYCLKCDDIVRLTDKKHRECECGHCGGKYIDNLNAVYYGSKAKKLGIDNTSLGIKFGDNLDRWAIWNLNNGYAIDDGSINAFVIGGLGECSKTFVKVTKKEYFNKTILGQ